MRTMRVFLLLFLAACGGTLPWASKWKEPVQVGVASYVECTLGGSGHTITGSGVQHREAGADLAFTVSGTTEPVPFYGVTFTYESGATEQFAFGQPGPDHLTLSSVQRTLDLIRVSP